jgi:large subunit ribosomal protein L4
MTTIEIKDASGKKAGTADLAASVFGIEPNVPVMHQVVRAQRASWRQGTHDTKTRGQVRGGGKKPWRQKGTGRARQGTIRAPQWAGGGTVFGPHPRSYAFRVNNKEVKLAMRSALSAKLADGELFVVDAFNFEKPSTKAAVAALKARLGASHHPRHRRRGREHLSVVPQHPHGEHPARVRGEHLRADRQQGSRVHGRRPEAHRGGACIMKDPREVIIRPVITEHSYDQMEGNTFTFEVAKDANKVEIRQAIEAIFDVTVVKVNTLNVKPKPKRVRYQLGKTRTWKKAMVTLKEGDTIELFA